MPEILKIIAKNVRYYRLKKHLTQKQLARKAKLSQGYICKVEQGKINMYLTTLLQIANGLGIKIRKLVI